MIAKRKRLWRATGALVLLIGISVVLLHLSRSDQPGLAVSGIVKDAATGRPIAGATVSDDGYGPKPYKGGSTDAAGKYRYATWQEEHLIVAQAPGYRAQRQTLTTSLFRSEKEKVLEFALLPE
jgi:hypothetical protein